MKIAVQNIHNIPGIFGNRFQNYAVELIKRGYISTLYFDDLFLTDDRIRKIKKRYSATDLGLNKVDFTFSSKKLNETCDVLINFDSSPKEFTPTVKHFKGLKIFHVMDYFWFEPASVKAARLKEYGIDYIMSYGSPDIYDPFFKKHFSEYDGKVIPIPFGFADRFSNKNHFRDRLRKCVALGSVRPIRFTNENPRNFEELATFYPHEQWFHKFRRMLVENKDQLIDIMDSMLPEFPRYRDYDFDMVTKLNSYQMFTSDESICYFPSAKTFEGPATGCVLVASDHPCFRDFGFINGENCLTHKEFSINDFKRVVEAARKDQTALEAISNRGENFVRNEYSHRAIADKLYLIIDALHRREDTGSLSDFCYNILRNSIPGEKERLLSSARRGPRLTLASILYTYLGFAYLVIAETFFLLGRMYEKIRRHICAAS